MLATLTISQALDHCIEQDPEDPKRFKVDRAKYQDDEQLVRDYAENPKLTEGLWRMLAAGRLSCTCEAIVMHFDEFDDETRNIVLEKITRLLESWNVESWNRG